MVTLPSADSTNCACNVRPSELVLSAGFARKQGKVRRNTRQTNRMIAKIPPDQVMAIVIFWLNNPSQWDSGIRNAYEKTLIETSLPAQRYPQIVSPQWGWVGIHSNITHKNMMIHPVNIFGFLGTCRGKGVKLLPVEHQQKKLGWYWMNVFFHRLYKMIKKLTLTRPWSGDWFIDYMRRPFRRTTLQSGDGFWGSWLMMLLSWQTIK